MFAADDFAPVRQGVHQLFGLAVPYWTPKPWTAHPTQSTDLIQFAAGCATAAIRRQQIDLQLEYVFYEFLADSRHGLRVFETPSGVCFEASLPDSAFARQIMRAVGERRIRHVCCLGEASTRPASATPGLHNVVAFDLATINLLVDSKPCLPETWVTTDRGEFLRRLRQTDDQVREWLAGKLAGEPLPAHSN